MKVKNLRGEVSKFKSVYQNYFQDVIKEVKWKKMEDNFLMVLLVPKNPSPLLGLFLVFVKHLSPLQLVLLLKF